MALDRGSGNIIPVETGSGTSYDAAHQPHVNSGANIGFKVGMQATVDQMIGAPNQYPATHGSFYLTQDTHRLYVGNSDGTLSAINEGITTVSDVSQLPDLSQNPAPYIGRFYYIKDTGVNILCVASYNNGVAQWVQLNPDTYLNTTTSGVTVANDTGADTANGVTGAKVTNVIADTGGRILSQAWTLRGLKNITVEANTGTNLITLSVPDSGIYNQFYESVSEGNTVVGVKVSLRQYTSVAATEADTTGTAGTLVKEFILKKGNGGVTPVLQADGKTIMMDGGGLRSGRIALSGGTGSPTSPITFTLTDGNNNSISTEVTPTITVGDTPINVPVTLTQTATQGVNGATENKYALNASLPVYTKSEVDNIISSERRTADAMYFAGTIGTGGTVSNLNALITSTNLQIKNGATFKLITAEQSNIVGVTAQTEGFIPGAISSNPMEVGDLIIVTGTEGSDGYITDLNATTTKYTYIPSGNDDDIYFEPDLATGKYVKWIQHPTSNPNAKTYQLEFDSNTTDNLITITDSGVTTSGNTISKKISIGHATIAQATATADTGVTMEPGKPTSATEYTAVTAVTTDGYGHVTGYTTKKLSLFSNKLTAVESKVATDSSVTGESAVLVSRTYTQSTGPLTAGNSNNNVRYSSNTLTITAAAAGSATGTANTAADVHIDMLWGSF